ncbi:MAG TPA: serine protease [Balneolales bacterium]|nr:serine protease [Balneolales bacterium]
MSRDLSHLFQSVKRITSTAFYNTYLLARTPAVYDKRISLDRISRLAEKKAYTNHSSAGTALVLSSSANRVLLITCAHIITFPDTVIQYYQASQSGELRPVKFVAYKDRQTNLLIDNQTLGFFDIIAVDTKRDLALLGIHAKWQGNDTVTPMDFAPGDAKELKIGSFTYTLGYPKGYQMIVHAIVGDVMHPPYGSFLIDAPFNHGFSGGVVMALNGESQRMEWVGMANSSSATAEFVLKPDEISIKNEDLNDLYNGPIILEQQNLIDYGITRVIPINVIKDFIRQNEKTIRNHGFRVPDQFHL